MRWRKVDRERRKAEAQRAAAESAAEYDRRKAAEQARKTQQAADREQEMREGLPDLPKDAQGPVCSRCHGRQFDARHDTRDLITGGLLVAGRSVVECVTCGKRYYRG